MRKPNLLIALLLALSSAASFSGALLGHGAVIRLGAEAVAAGDSLSVTGEGMGQNVDVTLALEGPSGTKALATVRGDEHGRFRIVVVIPVGTAAGAYRVVAMAGDDRATADLLVTAGAAGSAGADDHGLHAPTEATPAAMDLDRRRTGVETGLAWSAALLLVGLGVWLARRPRRED